MNTARPENTTMTDTGPSRRVLGALRDALGSVFARVYLAGCVVLSGWAVVVSLLDNPDASFAGVVPVLATLPASLLVIVLPDHWSMIFLPIALGAVVNAALIGWCARALSRGRARSRPSAGSDRPV